MAGNRLEVKEKIDYIVHLASPTSSRFFSENPVDTMTVNIEGTRAVLELARNQSVEKVIFSSSMEVYGIPEKGHKVTEVDIGRFQTTNPRNSYPIAKIACEALCHSYFAQYAVPATVLRFTQTFGPGVKYEDGRIFAYFMRCVIEKKDIVLKTAGLTERSYLYTADAVSAILVALLKGKTGEAYTAANPDTYCSIREMAEMAAGELAKGRIKVVYDIAEDVAKLGYAQTLYMDLNTDKLEQLGWKPDVNLQSAFSRMIRCVTDGDNVG